MKTRLIITATGVLMTAISYVLDLPEMGAMVIASGAYLLSVAWKS